MDTPIIYTCRECKDQHDDIEEMSDPQGDGNLICLTCLSDFMSQEYEVQRGRNRDATWHRYWVHRVNRDNTKSPLKSFYTEEEAYNHITRLRTGVFGKPKFVVREKDGTYVVLQTQKGQGTLILAAVRTEQYAKEVATRLERARA